MLTILITPMVLRSQEFGDINFFYINKIATGKATYEDTAKMKSLTYKIQNQGMELQESYHSYRLSLEYIDKALFIWTQIKDTANEANLHKFKGLLLANLGSFSEAKKEVSYAIKLFSLKKIDYGVAVSDLDFSKVYDMEGNYDSAMYYAKLSLDFWIAKSDTFRILTVRNQQIYVAFKLNDRDLARKIQLQTEPLLNDKTLYWLPVIDFYYLSMLVYGESNIEPLKGKYERLYNEKRNEVQPTRKSEVCSSFVKGKR